MRMPEIGPSFLKTMIFLFKKPTYAGENSAFLHTEAHLAVDNAIHIVGKALKNW